MKFITQIEPQSCLKFRICTLPESLLSQLEDLIEKTVNDAKAADHSCAQRELIVDIEWLGYTFSNVEVTVFARVGLLPSLRPCVVNVSACASWFDAATRIEACGYAEGLVVWDGAPVQSPADAWHLAIEEAFWDLEGQSAHVDGIFDAWREGQQLAAAVPALVVQRTPGEKGLRL